MDNDIKRELENKFGREIVISPLKRTGWEYGKDAPTVR
jgi:hypothetical protein